MTETVGQFIRSARIPCVACASCGCWRTSKAILRNLSGETSNGFVPLSNTIEAPMMTDAALDRHLEEWMQSAFTKATAPPVRRYEVDLSTDRTGRTYREKR